MARKCDPRKCYYCEARFTPGNRIVILGVKPCLDIAHASCFNKNKGRSR